MELNPYNANIFANRVLKWYKGGGAREFPWRKTRNGYKVLVAELMLRRTRADQVVPVYKRFVERYPNPQSLAKAPPRSIRALLRPLGLEWRAENIVKLSKELQREFDGEVPTDPADLKRLTGVGDYVAGAVCCFAFNIPTPMIDTNIVRVIGRVFGLSLEGEARRRLEVKDAVTTCLHQSMPREYHYALLDFGAKVCRAREPLCTQCPFGKSKGCQYYGTVQAT